MVLVPSPSYESGDNSHSVISGAIYGSAMVGQPLSPFLMNHKNDFRYIIFFFYLFDFSQLHHVRAPLSQPIAPVTYMWKPLDKQDREGDSNCINAVGRNRSHETECHLYSRQLWLWIHASAFGEGFDALQLACQKQVKHV